jgi:formiminoglutamase
VAQIGVINIDAHFDVRPLKNGLAHSGSPFRQLLEDVRFSKQLTPPAANSQPQYRFIEYAAQGSQCSKEHADYLLKAGNGQSKIYWVNDPIDEFKHSERPLGGSARAQHFADVLHRMGGQALFVSFDLDAVTGADAPGVSCPGTIGLSAHDALFMAYSAGLNPRVRLFDLSEFNPKFDEYRTGRLVANMFYYFCLGVAGRKQPATS